MKENKECKVTVRLTKSEKAELVAYCEQYDVKMSEVLREAIFDTIRKNLK